jgi:hypothetical protein
MSEQIGALGTLAALPDQSLAQLCGQALAMLERALGEAPAPLTADVDVAERLVVELRDDLIERLRREPGNPLAPAWRAALQRTNAALSLVVGVEYPSGGVHRKLIEQARDTLRALIAA